jgi:hypothetical protein
MSEFRSEPRGRRPAGGRGMCGGVAEKGVDGRGEEQVRRPEAVRLAGVHAHSS